MMYGNNAWNYGKQMFVDMTIMIVRRRAVGDVVVVFAFQSGPSQSSIPASR